MHEIKLGAVIGMDAIPIREMDVRGLDPPRESRVVVAVVFDVAGLDAARQDHERFQRRMEADAAEAALREREELEREAIEAQRLQDAARERSTRVSLIAI